MTSDSDVEVMRALLDENARYRAALVRITHNDDASLAEMNAAVAAGWYPLENYSQVIAAVAIGQSPYRNVVTEGIAP